MEVNMQKMLRLNTKTGVLKVEPFPEKYRFYGKRGLVDRFLFDEVPPQCDPLGPENKLVICTGVFAGTAFPEAGRISAGGKSPLTGTIKESSAGGMIGPRMAEHEIKLISLEDKPKDDAGWKIIHIDGEGQLSLIDATEYLGLGTYEFSEKMLERFSRDAGVMVIGPAGEMLYRSAAIMVSEFRTGHTCRAAGRGGLGALMGSKKIKGMVIEKAVKKPEFDYADKERFETARKRYVDAVKNSPPALRFRDVGSTNMMDVTGPLGFVPYKNFSGLPLPEEHRASFTSKDWKEAVVAYGGKTAIICHPGCVILCSNVVKGKDGEFITAGLEYESVAMLGPNLGIFDYYRTAKFDFECDDIGLDCIETGCALGVCMEAGKISWGDADGVDALFDEMRRGTEFGKLLGAGTEVIGKALGVTRIPVVKGQGLAAYDPRGLKGYGITYSVSTQGADHTWGALANPAATDDEIPDLVFNSIIDTTIRNDFLCSFGSPPFREDPKIMEELYAGVFGGEWTVEKLREIAFETIKIERMFNEAAGFTDADDRLPEFMRNPEAQLEGALPPFPYSDEQVCKNINIIYKYKKQG
ncbi:MAG: aldehyde ferredoxin oxidoreductase [Clostridiales bacterium]|nr:aldehyde ferredoxin oxidoreductase [Clostridiales bacterium]